MKDPSLKYVDLQFADNALEEPFETIVRMIAPVDVVVHLSHGHLDGQLDSLQAQFAAVGSQGLQLLLVIVLVHVDGQRLDHVGDRGEAITIAAIKNKYITQLLILQDV